jgi:hypothetical protein
MVVYHRGTAEHSQRVGAIARVGAENSSGWVELGFRAGLTGAVRTLRGSARGPLLPALLR